MTQGKSIFIDLEIDASLMMTDPDTFAEQVLTVGDELTSIFSGTVSVKSAEDDATKQAKMNRVAKEVAYKSMEAFNDPLVESAETMDMDELYYTIQELKSTLENLQLTFHSRSRNAMIMSSANITDKKLAHTQYKKLRDAFGAFIEFSKLMNSKTYVNLKPKTGNYTSDATGYPAYRYEGEVYQNYRAVASLIGEDPNNFKNHQDLVDWVRENNMGETIEVIEITL